MDTIKIGERHYVLEPIEEGSVEVLDDGDVVGLLSLGTQEYSVYATPRVGGIDYIGKTSNYKTAAAMIHRYYYG